MEDVGIIETTLFVYAWLDPKDVNGAIKKTLPGTTVFSTLDAEKAVCQI